MLRSGFRTGVAAILAGALYFAGQGGELVFDDYEPLWIVLGCAGIVSMGVALWGLRDLISGSRSGRIGMRLALAGFGLLGLFAVQVAVEQIRTGDLPDNWVLFALGFLLLIAGQLLFAHDLRATLGRAWLLPLVALAGLVVALAGGENPVHDVGLFVFEAAWVALGVAILHTARRAAPASPAVPV